MLIPILRLYEVLPGRERDFRELLIGLVTWLRQFPEVQDARAFGLADQPAQFCTWAAWRNLEARDRCLQSKHWARRTASMVELQARPSRVYTSDVLLEEAFDTPSRGVTMLGLFQSRPGAEAAFRQRLLEHGREIAQTCRPVRICIGQAVEDRTRFFGFFESETLGVSPAERLCACPHACLTAMAQMAHAPIEWHRLEALTEAAAPGVSPP